MVNEKQDARAAVVMVDELRKAREVAEECVEDALFIRSFYGATSMNVMMGLVNGPISKDRFLAIIRPAAEDAARDRDEYRTVPRHVYDLLRQASASSTEQLRIGPSTAATAHELAGEWVSEVLARTWWFLRAVHDAPADGLPELFRQFAGTIRAADDLNDFSAVDCVAADLRSRIQLEYDEAMKLGGCELVGAAGRFVPQPEDLDILRVLADAGTTMTQERILGVVGRQKMPLGDKALRKRLRNLRGHDLTHRPRGPKGGEAITDAGRALLPEDDRQLTGN